MIKAASYIVSIMIGLIMIAPPIDYSIPLIINSFFWCYIVIACGLCGIWILHTNISVWLKLLSVYLFIICFISEVPYLSFNAYILIVITMLSFLIIKKIDFEVFLDMVEIVFLFQIILASMQLLGKDTLINFNRPESVFLGSVMQCMRFASLFACMTPFLILRRKWYILPIVIVCVVSKSAGFAFSLIGSCVVYGFLKSKGRADKIAIVFGAILVAMIYSAWDAGSFQVAFHEGRIPVWGVIIQTWLFDTIAQSNVYHFDLQSFLFGRGIDTFLTLFPLYKHDVNPFPQAHNCWMQFLWEIGIVGTLFIVGYFITILKKLYESRHYLLISGVACIAINMCFAFPTRMTQTMFLIVAFAALCEQSLDKTEMSLSGSLYD